MMPEFRRFLTFLRPYTWLLLLAVVGLILVSALRLVFPYVGKFLADEILPKADYTLLNQFALFLLGLVIVQTAINVGQTYLLTYVGENVVTDLRERLYQKLISLDLAFFTERSVGEITSRLTNDVTAVQNVVTSQLTSFFTELLVFLGALGLILWIDWRLASVMLAIVPPVVFVARYFGSKLRVISTEVQDQLAQSTSVVEETIGGVRLVKSFVREADETKRYHTAIGKTLQAALRRAKYRAMFVPIITCSGFGGLVLVLWYGGHRLLSDPEFTPGDLISFLFYTVMIAGSVGTFAGVYSQIQEALGALRRIFELLDEQPQIVTATAATPLVHVEGSLTFEEVSFGYDEQLVLGEISLTISPGEIVALVGPSGGGKTTLMNLVCRFYDPTHGRILLDQTDLKALPLDALRQQIGMVPQDIVLFSRSIRENILYGNPQASEEQILEAAIAANADAFIRELPQGYDTQVGERGVKLSGGQRQRIAIARTLLKDPKILLLDEATSALDSESEHQVQQALHHLLQGRTTLIIAHRLATVQIAHRVVVLDQGRIVEMGTHEELLAGGGLYSHLYGLQFRSVDSLR